MSFDMVYFVESLQSAIFGFVIGYIIWRLLGRRGTPYGSK